MVVDSLDTDEVSLAQPLTLVSYQLKLLHKDVMDVRQSITKLTETLTRVAIIEERQEHTNTSIQQLLEELRTLHNRLDATEVKLTQSEAALKSLNLKDNRVNVWLDRAIWATIAMLGMYVAKKVGLIL